MSEIDVDFDRLADDLGGVRDAPLGEMTTYRVGGGAAVLVRVESLERLRRVAQILAEVDVPVLVIGRGSNMLVADRGFRGVAVQLGDFAAECEIWASAIGLPGRPAPWSSSAPLSTTPMSCPGGKALSIFATCP